MDTIRLSVVIPTFNRKHVLEHTLPALLQQDFPPEQFELIYILDGSTDGTAEMLRALKPACALQVLEQPNQGPSAARNKGIQVARGDLILFLDDDLISAPSLFQHHSAAHKNLDSVVVHGPVYVSPESPKTLIRYMTEVQYEDCYRHRDPALGLQDSDWHAQWIGAAATNIPSLLLRHEFFVKSSHAFVKQPTTVSARGELYVCREHPEYRPHSRLAKVGLGGGWKRVLRIMAARSPLSLVPLLTLPIWMAERLNRFVPIRKAGIRMLEIATDTSLHRAALRETGSWRALQREFGMRLPVLMYHHVGPSIPHTYAELTVLPKQFERQIRWLARRGYVGIRPSDWVEWRRSGKGLPDKHVLLTFDDGYADLAEHALPVLRRYGFGAVVFIVTGLVGGTNAWDEARGSATHRLLTAEQIRYWATQGIEFGAHSRTHADLTTLSAEELAKEIVGGRDELANLLGSPVTSFAYPYGAYNQTVNTCAQGVYSLTFRADESAPGINYLCTDPHDLQRTMIHPKDSLADLECRLRWGHSPILEMRERLHLRSRLKRLACALLGRKAPDPPGEFSS